MSALLRVSLLPFSESFQHLSETSGDVVAYMAFARLLAGREHDLDDLFDDFEYIGDINIKAGSCKRIALTAWTSDTVRVYLDDDFE